MESDGGIKFRMDDSNKQSTDPADNPSNLSYGLNRLSSQESE